MPSVPPSWTANCSASSVPRCCRLRMLSYKSRMGDPDRKSCCSTATGLFPIFLPWKMGCSTLNASCPQDLALPPYGFLQRLLRLQAGPFLGMLPVTQAPSTRRLCLWSGQGSAVRHMPGAGAAMSHWTWSLAGSRYLRLTETSTYILGKRIHA